MSYEYTIDSANLKICNIIATYVSKINNECGSMLSVYEITDDHEYKLIHRIDVNKHIIIDHNNKKYDIFFEQILSNGIYAYKLKIVSDSKNDIDTFINDAIDSYTIDYLQNKYISICYTSKHTHDINTLKTKISLHDVKINETLKTNILTDIKYFYESKNNYDSLGITHKKTYLLHGDEHTIFKLVCAYASMFNKFISVVDFNDLAQFFNRSFSIKNQILYVENIPDEQILTNINNFSNGLYDMSGTVMFLCRENITHLNKQIYKICDDIYQIKRIDEKQIKEIYKSITGKTNECVNEFYNSIKHIDIDVLTLQHFLLKPPELQDIGTLTQLCKLKKSSQNHMTM